jgi:hypothetical protein
MVYELELTQARCRHAGLGAAAARLGQARDRVSEQVVGAASLMRRRASGSGLCDDSCVKDPRFRGDE